MAQHKAKKQEAAFAASCHFSVRSENLSRQAQFFLRRKIPVEVLHVLIIHIAALRRPVYAGDTVQISRDQLFAESEPSSVKRF